MASKYLFNKETVNYVRLTRLTLNVVRDLLISVLKAILQPQELSNILKSQRTHFARVLSESQLHILYPPVGVFQDNFQEFDISIIYKLLRHLQGIGISPPMTGWGRKLNETDRSVAANIERLRMQRTDLAHSPTAFISDSNFKIRLELIRQSVFEIEKDVLNGDTYVRAVDDLLTMDIQPNEEKMNILVPEKNVREENMAATKVKDVHEKEANYKRIMEKKTETQTIKLTFIGHALAGKTCLMRQLLRKHIKPGGPDRTNLAELLTKRLRYKLGTSAKEMEKIEKGKEAELCRQRLRRLRKRQADTRTYQRNDLSKADSNADTDQNLNIDDGKEDSNYQQNKSSHVIYERQVFQLSDSQRKSIEDANKENDGLDDSSVAYVTMFDFGGDEIFRNYHHCIMSANSIYLLVFDVSLWETPDNQDQILGEIKYWLNAVVTYAKDEFDDREGIPPIIMIGSHMDKVTTAEEQICDVIWTKLQERQPDMEDILDQHVKEIFFIAEMDNSDLNAEKYLDVWCEIEKCVHLQSCWHDIITGTWLALEEKLMLEKEKGIKFLNIEQILEINSEMLVPLEENDLVSFLRYMHNAASIICFDIFGKTDFKSLTDQDKKQLTVILDINWIIKAFGAIITDDNFVDLRSNKQRMMWKKYKTTAILTEEVISLQWANVTKDYRDVLISQIKNLGLITERIPKGHIVPCLLGEASSDCVRQILTNESLNVTKTLCLIFHYQFVPQVTWDKTVAFCMSKFGECTYSELGHEKSPKRDLICRNIDDIWNFVLHCRGAMLKLTMFNHHEQPVTNGVGNNLRLKIEDIIKTVLSMTNQGHRQFAYYLHCDVCIDDGESHVGKPLIETMRKRPKYNVKDARGNSSFLTQDDCNAWFGDNVIETQAQFTDMTKVKQIHAKMVRDLSTWIYPELQNRWENFLVALTPHLPDQDLYVDSGNSFFKVCSCLRRKGVIKYGEYGILREIVHSIHVDAAEIIDNAMLKLDALRM